MSVPVVFRRITTALDRAGIGYMLTGSFASAHYGVPRSTQDIDFVIEATPAELRLFVEALSGNEYYADLDSALEAHKQRSMFNVIDLATGWKIDLIIRKSRAFSQEEFRRRQRMSLHDVPLSVASAEDVVISKLEWAKLAQSHMSQAKRQAQAGLALSNGRGVEAVCAIALGLASDSAQATRLATDLAKRFPEDTIVQFEYLPMIHAAAALSGGSATKAIEALAPAAPYELGGFNLYPVYLRGEAYVAAHQGSAAAAEFQKILDHPGVVVNAPIGALALLGLARAYALSGDTTKSKTAYQDFFALWKDADPDIPILKEAKAEYAKLQ